LSPVSLKAFLLTAGLGTRLRPLTCELPKCLLPIDGKPLLQIWLEHLSNQGIEEVLINTHWLHKKVDAFLAEWPAKNLRVKTFHEPNLLGSAGTILANRQWVGKGNPFFILYGDNLTNVNLQKMLSFHRGHGRPFTLGVFKAENPRQCGIAEVDTDGLVIGFLEKPQEPKSDLAAAGVYIADDRIFNFFPENEAFTAKYLFSPLDFGYHIIPRLVGKMKAYFIEEFLMDIGTLQQYKKAQTLWMR
jgi:mannose-1-phosphate guanylyltransferase